MNRSGILRTSAIVSLVLLSSLVPHTGASQSTLDGLVSRCSTGTDPAACHALGQARARGEGGLPRDLMRALVYLDEACNAGISAACTDYRALNDTGVLPASTESVPPVPSASNIAAPADMLLIRAGTFTMGSPASEAGRDSDETQRVVTLTRDFWLSATEVTQDEYRSLVGINPSHFSACGGGCPVENVSWLDAVAYANARSSAEGLRACYDTSGVVVGVATIYDCVGYRLPTEAEWEYAARAGSTAATDGPLATVAWFMSNSNNRTHPVGEKQANAWSLYDMLGNVWEWTHDWYAPYDPAVTTDPAGANSSSFRVFRGCSWCFNARFCRSAYRRSDVPSYRNSYIGFRLARTAP